MLTRKLVPVRLAAAATSVLLLLGVASPAGANTAGGTVFGSVQASGHVSATGVDVWIYTAAGVFVEDTVSDEHGDYSFDKLSPGSYIIRFENQNEATLEWYDNKPDMENAVPIPVTATSSTRIDAYMPVSGENLTVPTIAGTPAVGATLASASGTWFPTPSFGFTYQWMRASTPIAGATAATYAVTPSDVGQRLSVAVTANNYGSVATATSVETAPVTSGATPTVVNTSLPVVNGTVKVGSAVSATPGVWTPSLVTPTYQWLRAGNPIGGATGATYVISGADSGLGLSVQVTASQAGHLPGIATSASSTVASGTFSIGQLPTVTGTPRIGGALTASSGTWSPTPTTLSYTWIDAKSKDVLATGASSSYVPGAADLGRTVAVTVSAGATGYTAATSTSDATTPVTADAPVNTARPILTGTARVGSTLSTTSGTWTSPVTVRYRWLRGGVTIPGATTRTYKLAAADAGRKVSAQVMATGGGHQVIATSGSTGAVAKATSKVTATGKSSGRRKATITVKVSTLGSRAGRVTVSVSNGRKTLKKTATVSPSGIARISFSGLAKGKRKVTVAYAGSSSANAAKSTTNVRVK